MPMKGVYNETGQAGDYTMRVPKWKGGIAVTPGDLVFRDTGDGYDKPMSSYTWNTDLATTAGTANAVVRGVAMARRTTAQTTDGDQSDGCIAETGEFCMDCAALGSAAKPGDLVSFAQSGVPGLENQKVLITVTAGQAFGRVSRDAAVGATSLYFTLLTPLMYGGPTAPA